ncbi:nucleotide exchange factor SIL1 [Archocentrus centrarchus]|uniref:nucleotide exchange factor SIL1 n=1 Tax=Archocentrus centrarchus TaxID=63155 RepID=UPI0011E9B87D|nr:nucleotide exchange factor SIL1 [Archocentrus centrarchus]XP_030595685.1 nucleotide exchange factor SIL1 [Archocentrus centrarchus]XP_030595686.1 nucleotide exchange factor SIL1 [Archocentrus centrarchus]
MTLISSHAGGASFIIVFLVVLHCCHIASILGQKSGGALIVVENTEHEGKGGDEEEEVTVGDSDDDDEGDLEVVQPTEQWQTLKPGQAVPPGSHVRLNLQTGEREVRLGEEQLKYWTQEHREREEIQSAINPDELKRAMKKIKEDLKLASKDTDQKDSVASQFRTVEELKKDMAQLDLLMETDVQIMRRLLDQFNSSNSTTEQRLSILMELEYLVHQVDNAQTLCSMGGLKFILEGLNSSDFRLQEGSAFVLGSALASNPAVQVEAVENGALQTLLTTLATAQQLRVKKKVLFAVASLLRHFPYAQHHFLTHGGLQVLSELFRADDGGILRTRIVAMLYDIITEKELISQAGLDPGLAASSHDERRRQYSKVSLKEELLEKGWCTLVPRLLEAAEHDYREKALRALLAMAPVCLDHYRSDSSLQASLHSLKQQYQEMSQSEMILGEENSYFAEIVELIDALQVKMK